MSIYVNGSARLTSGGDIPAPAGSDPASPITGQVYFNTTKNNMRHWDGSKWMDVSIGDTGFKYRTIITKMYVLGGYQNGSPWKNVNRAQASTDTYTNLGDQIVYSASYIQGAPSKTTAWVFSAANAHSTATNQVVGMNLSTETARAANSANYMWTTRQDAGVAFKETEYTYVCSKSSMDKFNFTTETSSNPGIGILGDGTGAGVQAICDENIAVLYNDGSSQVINFATSQILAAPQGAGANNQQKPINSKTGVGYGGHEGTYNGGYNYRKWNFSTNEYNQVVARPYGNIGEENYSMGQEHQYMHGEYDGAQNNNGHKFYYTTDSGYTLGAFRGGVPGGSSAATGWSPY